MVFVLIITAAVMMAPLGARAAEALATITILEGPALIYRGTGRLHAAEGVRLQWGDIFETDEGSFAQVEFADQAVAQFGPKTSAMLGTSTAKQKTTERWLYLMNGWAKVTGSKAEEKGPSGFDVRSRLFWVSPNTGVVVYAVKPDEATMFVERGNARLLEQQSGAGQGPVNLRAGDYYQRRAGERGLATARPISEFLADMPRGFRDSLPLRAERFSGQDVFPKDAGAFSYANVEPWLKAESWVRRPLVQRWRPKAKEADFRAALIANLSSHTEWDPILFPEKYLPKKPKPEPQPQARRAPYLEPAASELAPAER